MDIIQQLGELALGSRLRRLSERLAQDVAAIYSDLDLDYEPRWFPVYYLLLQKSPISICDAAQELGITHPMVSQIASEMVKRGVVLELRDENDKRKKMIALSEKGLSMSEKLAERWADVDAAAKEWTASTGFDVLAVLDRLEQALDAKSFQSRIQDHTRKRRWDAVTILDYDPHFKEDFKTINTEWIEQHFTLEEADRRILSNPETEIIEPGGHIFFARYKQEIVGTCALIRCSDGSYELAKMGVLEKARGLQIGKKLLAASIRKAKEDGVPYMTLETSSKLSTAIALYRKMGFVAIPFDPDHPSEFARADVRMKLDLSRYCPYGEQTDAILQRV